MKKAVFGLVKSEDQANRIVEHLLAAGFANEDISILCSDQKKLARLNPATGEYVIDRKKSGGIAIEKHTKAGTGAATGATAGGLIGGAIGLLAGLGALVIPGLGVLIAAGPLLGALSGSAIGGAAGLLIGALAGLGIPEYEAKKYATGLQNGNTLISVHTDNSKKIEEAKSILTKEGAHDISCSREGTCKSA
jgi:hypothetical protein